MQKKSSANIDRLTPNIIERLLQNTGDMALKRRAREILLNIDVKKGDNILDIGCGDGYYLHLLSSAGIKGLKLTGCDFDPPALEAAKRNLQGKGIPLFKGDLMKRLPFATGTFNKIIMSEVVEHLPDDDKCLREVKRVLAPGGTLCLSVPNLHYPMLWDPINWFLERLTGRHISHGFFAGLWAKHIRLYTVKDFSNVLTNAGFKVQVVKPLTVWSLPFNHNIVHFGARLLHSGGLSPQNARSINKFEVGRINRPWHVKVYFNLVEKVDRLNDFYGKVGDIGVGVFAKVTK